MRQKALGNRYGAVFLLVTPKTKVRNLTLLSSYLCYQTKNSRDVVRLLEHSF